MRSHISGSLKFLACKSAINAYVTPFCVFACLKISTQP
ncbi:hypothetical protein HFN_0433 [Helicobacter fennelliae MRY12-0050]|uniref:Uncharacterized protein n=1 Tax=Helicobacter fennelliae MRY12-0050 TaxID=1325130 RepID=T1DWC3_9HELI|nr:hypothetical protein HFN_0433 [Helicobacter fennelliae MRY12-0050]